MLKKGLGFLLKFSWENNKKYIIYLFLNQIFIAIPPILMIILPKLIIDELMNKNRIEVVLVMALSVCLFILLCNLLSSFFKNNAFIERTELFKVFQLKLGDKLARVDFSCLEDPSFLDLKEKADKFLYANGQGFGFVMDRAVNIIGKLFIFAGVIGIIASLNILILILFIILVAINSYFQMKKKKSYAEMDLQKTPIERRTAYYSRILSEYPYGKEIRNGDSSSYILDHLKDTLTQSVHFYRKQMNLIKKSEYLTSVILFIQRIASYAYMIYSVSKAWISIGDFTMYISGVSTFNDAMNDVVNSV